MSSLQEYCKKLSTEQLEALLREYCEGSGDLSVDVALTIYSVLAERDPQLPDAREAFRCFCRNYLS